MRENRPFQAGSLKLRIKAFQTLTWTHLAKSILVFKVDLQRFVWLVSTSHGWSVLLLSTQASSCWNSPVPDQLSLTRAYRYQSSVRPTTAILLHLRSELVTQSWFRALLLTTLICVISQTALSLADLLDCLKAMAVGNLSLWCLYSCQAQSQAVNSQQLKDLDGPSGWNTH